MSSKAIVADNKIVFILFLKERSIESAKKNPCYEPIPTFRRRKHTLLKPYILDFFSPNLNMFLWN